MSEKDNLRKLLNDKFATKQDLIGGWPGQMGDGYGTVNVSSREHYVYVRVASQIQEVFNNRVPAENDLLVTVGFDPAQPNLYQVLSTRTSTPGGLTGGAITGYAPAIRYQWMATGGGQDPLFVEKRQYLPLRIGPYSGMTIQVYRDFIWTGSAFAAISTQTVDLTTYVPTTADKAALVLITIDNTGTLVETKGSEVDIADLASSDLPAVPAGTREVLGAVRVYYGQTAIQEARTNTDIVDLRNTWTPAGAGILADHDHSGDTGDGGQFFLTNLLSTGANDGQFAAADGAGGITWENQFGGLDTAKYFIDGRLAVQTGVGGAYIVPRAMTIRAVYIYCATIGTASSTIVDVNKNGTTIFTTQGNRPMLAYTDLDGVGRGVPDVTTLNEFDVLTVDIDQAAPVAAGLTVMVAFDGIEQDDLLEIPPDVALNSYKLGPGDTDNIALALGGAGAWDSSRIYHPHVIEYKDTLYLFYAGTDGGGTISIGVATAPVSGFTGKNWTKHAGNPILTVGAGGSWDETGAFAPWVIYDEDAATWKMWYTGRNAVDAWKLGYATASSPFGTWTKYGSNPIMTSGGWEGTQLHHPAVIRESATSYKMLYSADEITTSAEIGLATSTDGISWTKYASNPVISAEGSGWDAVSVFKPTGLVQIGKAYYLFFAGKEISGTGKSKIGLAWSTDLINWTMSSNNAVLTASKTWEGTNDPPGEVEGPAYIQVGTDQYIFYSCWMGVPSTLGVLKIP
jgi:hypothetical protein